MKIAGIQFKPVFGDKKTNLDKIYQHIENIDADMIIFPELATTGYFFLEKSELDTLAESSEGQTIYTIQEMATRLKKIIVIGFAEKAGTDIFNSAAVLIPGGDGSRIYRKSHLFYKEKFVFTPGDSGFFVIDYKEMDIKIGTMICYDWRFPEASRSLALLGADLIVCPSNLVTTVWHKVMAARAIENKVYFAVINRTGREKRGNEELFFNGESAIYGYNGERIAVAGVEEETVIFADINPSSTRKKSFNEYNDVFKDRRPELYKI